MLTGKTLTAECVAKQSGRPLLRLTLGDLGSAEMPVATNLAKYLDLATRWGAIILINNAETLLGRNQDGTAFETAFLRALEDHSGVIFLTTSKPGRLNDAVSSRVHLAIEYRRLDKEKRQRIWRTHIQQLLQQQDKPSWPENIPKIVIDQTTQHLVENDTGMPQIKHMFVSERDIKNAFHTAVKLARYEAARESTLEGSPQPKLIRMTTDHFKRAMHTKLHMKQTIDGIFGRNEDQRAMDEGMRKEGPADYSLYR